MPTKPTLRPAAALTTERLASKEVHAKESFENGVAQAAELIEKAHRSGQHSVNYLTFPKAVVEYLKALGYRVKFNPACGAGDMDSHTIEWD